MHPLLTGLAWFTLIGYLLTTLEFIIGNRTICKISEVKLPADANNDPADNYPKVSVIIPARNEERNIEEALTSVLHLDYPHYELIVLNDRSEDATGSILERMSLQFPQLQVVHIQELPSGWLGKNYALFRGAQAASGELLLFTDADIVMAPLTLKRAVAYLQGQALDHLAIWPEIRSEGWPLKILSAALFTVGA